VNAPLRHCDVDECGRPVTARGLCRMHYLREWRSGTVTDAPLRDRSRHVCPAEHPHDLDTCWREHGCRCDRCRHLRKMERQRRRNRMIAYGRSDEISPATVPVEDVRPHIVQLHEFGKFALERIADAARVSRTLVLDIYYGPRGKEKRSRQGTPRRIREVAARRLLMLTPDQISAPLVPAIGTIRRLQALVAIGYSQTQLSERLGVQVTNLSHLIHGQRERVTAATYVATLELFRELWAQPRSGARAAQAKAVARANGWVGPLSWDDIDDPDEQPNNEGGDQTVAESFDAAAVDLALSGVQVKLRDIDRQECVRRLHAQRWGDRRIAEKLGCAIKTVARDRSLLALPGIDPSEQERPTAA